MRELYFAVFRFETSMPITMTVMMMIIIPYNDVYILEPSANTLIDTEAQEKFNRIIIYM